MSTHSCKIPSIFSTTLLKAVALPVIAFVCVGSTQAASGCDSNIINKMTGPGFTKDKILKVCETTLIKSNILTQPSDNSVGGEIAFPQIEFSTITKYIDIYNIRWGSKDEALEISGLRGEQLRYYEMYRPMLFELRIKNNLPGDNVTLYSLAGVGIVLDGEKLKCGEVALFTRAKYNLWQMGFRGRARL